MPYAGRYYMVYLVELLTPSRDEGWRVFVNAESGAVHDEIRIIGPARADEHAFQHALLRQLAGCTRQRSHSYDRCRDHGR
ncbi:MAG: hypothetical protein V9H69_17780 [Anaerolineae bacterium]